MRVLVITDWFTPGYKAGGPIQSVSRLVDQLKEHLTISVITRDRDLLETLKYPSVDSDQWTEMNGFQVMYCSLSKEDQLLRQVIFEGDYDYVYLNSFFSAKYTLKPLYHLWKYGQLDKVVLAPRGMLGEGALSLKSGKKQLLIKLLKLSGIVTQIRFHSTDASETKAIQNVFGNAKIHEVPNFPISIPDNELLPKSRELRLISVGRVASVKGYERIIPLVSKLEYSFNIYGNIEDQSYFEQCLALDTNKCVNFRGGLPPVELYPLLREHDFFILPTLNENFGHAIIEALAHGCPVIISDQTPWNDLESFGAGWVIPLNDLERWEKVLKEANSMDRSSYLQMSEKAKSYVRSKFDFSEIRRRYLDLFNA